MVILDSGLTFAIMILSHTLLHAARDIYGVQMRAVGFESRFLDPHFPNAGWCPLDISRIKVFYPLPKQCYFYLLGPPKNSKDHRKCNEDLCTANKVSEVDYEPKLSPSPT
jgi:hypothetical protein